MQRTPEPELMDEAAQALAYAEADFAEPDAAFVRACVAHLGAGLAGPVADLGCGPGNIALRLAAALPDSEVLGVDGSPAMLALARGRAAGVSNVHFRQALLPSPSLPAGHFAAVVSNSLLHHLHDPQVLWRTVKQIGRPGAPVCVGDLYRPLDAETARAFLEAYAAGEPEVLRQDFLASLHAAFDLPEIEVQLHEAGLDGWRVRAVDDRHVVITGHLPG